MYLRAVRTYNYVVMYSCISEHSELTSQYLCTHVSQSIQNLQVSNDVLMHLRAFRTYKSVVMYSCISEQSELTSQWLCTHASLSIHCYFQWASGVRWCCTLISILGDSKLTQGGRIWGIYTFLELSSHQFCVNIRALVSASITCFQIRMAGH